MMIKYKDINIYHDYRLVHGLYCDVKDIYILYGTLNNGTRQILREFETYKEANNAASQFEKETINV